MNGYFIWNAIMLILCIFNWGVVQMNDYSPRWARILLLVFVFAVAAITAMSYGTGPLSGSN